MLHTHLFELHTTTPGESIILSLASNSTSSVNGF